jgi:hypothetical protein
MVNTDGAAMTERPTPTVLVEQAVARGQTLDWICQHLHVDPAFVDRVLRRMDAANADHSTDETEPCPDCGRDGYVNLGAHRRKKHPAELREAAGQ